MHHGYYWSWYDANCYCMYCGSFCSPVHVHTIYDIQSKWGQNSIFLLSQRWVKKKKEAHCASWHPLSDGVPYTSAPLRLDLPLCWSINPSWWSVLHFTHSGVIPLLVIARANTKCWKFNESVKSVKVQHLHAQRPKTTPNTTRPGFLIALQMLLGSWEDFLGAGQGGGNRVLPALGEKGGPFWTFLQTPRSCWQECVNFKFQLSKWGFFFFFFSTEI